MMDSICSLDVGNKECIENFGGETSGKSVI
jgi:hypothetical protein